MNRKQLEAKLTAQQRRAAILLVENELETENKKTYEEIAEEVGITRMGLYKWRTQNRAFIEYKNLLADDILSSMRPLVYKQLLRTIMGSQPSIKGIDIFMRRFALLTDKQVTEDHGSSEKRSNEAIQKELEELDSMLEEKKTEPK
ncbi:Helix-turn-helix of insertion element transposase [Thermoactinomyces sp. DSM 45891]|uniref:phBC6A51 family helix-turn-helix protein n=1 Tax=unclassified Thermoactinomyces TaxID=2634588 RepID=UPI0008999EFF|nr:MULTISPECIES: phBC6A51 family helix-turn-helix protein [unclassified Thermoactinomyces]SDZ04947.1 Helix-turn-helix of insertion element transposase [Thermoactinomyces sp. DSM 45892]SFX48856.1 Helix-turn-helix of insertion element transposase [Thermoactinomyces sp. DSM 45891]